MSEEEIKDMILKQCLELTTNNDFRPPISAYDGVDIDDVVRTCKQLQDKKTYLDLVKENQELKSQLEVGEEQYNDLVKEKENLQEQLSIKTLQLEEYKNQVDKGLYSTCLPYRTGYNKAIEEKENQQKEFIEYMNKTIEELECDDVDDEELKRYLLQRIDTFKEILSKYKEIIGRRHKCR